MTLIYPQVVTTLNGKEQGTDLVSYALVKNRVIYLTGKINEESYLSTASQLRYLEGRSYEDIYMFINSPGGSVCDGLAIYDLMQESPCDIVTVGLGLAASMGSFLLSAGTKGKRYALKNTDIMIHQPLGGVQGQATDISLAADRILNVKQRLAAILAKNCGKKTRSVIRDMERDNWMNPQEALKYGLIDHIGLPA